MGEAPGCDPFSGGPSGRQKNALTSAAVKPLVPGLWLLVLTSCGGEKIVGPQQSAVFICHDVDAGASCAGENYGTIKPIIDRACVPCHFDSDAPDASWPLTTYDDVREWDDQIRIDVLNCSMPPRDAGVTMTDNERARVVNWIRRCNTAK
jgi:hypothetical protein